MAVRITTQEAAAILGVTPRRVRQLHAEGKLSADRVGFGIRSTLLLSQSSVLRLRRDRDARTLKEGR